MPEEIRYSSNTKFSREVAWASPLLLGLPLEGEYGEPSA